MKRMTAVLQDKMTKIGRYDLIRQQRRDMWIVRNIPVNIRDEEKHHLGVIAVGKF